jgi:hypothetical protein
MEKLKSKFKNEIFKTKEEFEGWLLAKTSKKIGLKDFGQDMLTIYLHESGEVLHCDFHSQIYNGCFINLANLKIGQPLEICKEGEEKFVEYGRLIPDEII